MWSHPHAAQPIKTEANIEEETHFLPMNKKNTKLNSHLGVS